MFKVCGLSFAGEALEISGPKAVFTGSLAGELLKYGLSHLSPPPPPIHCAILYANVKSRYKEML